MKAVGVLEVKLIEAKDLTNKDIIGKSDPFAKIFVRPLPDRTKTSKTIVILINLSSVLTSFYFIVINDMISFRTTIQAQSGMSSSSLK